MSITELFEVALDSIAADELDKPQQCNINLENEIAQLDSQVSWEEEFSVALAGFHFNDNAYASI